MQVFRPLTAEELVRTGVHTVQPLPLQTYRTVEKGHGRLEERQIRVSSELADYSAWPYLVQVFEYTRRWTAKGITKQQVRHGITSLPATVSTPQQVAALKRGHWQVENGLHYVKDVTLGEDECQTHVGAGADILALVRNIAISLLRRAGYRNIAASSGTTVAVRTTHLHSWVSRLMRTHKPWLLLEPVHGSTEWGWMI